MSDGSPPANGRATRRPSLDGGDDVGAVDARLLEDERQRPAVRAGDRGVDVVGLVVGGQEQVSVRVGEDGGVGADGGDRDDVVGQLERGTGARRPVRLQEHDGAGGLVDQRGVPVGLDGGDRRTFAVDDRLDGVEGVERQELGAVDPPHGHRRPVDDQGAAVDGVDRHVVADVDAAGLADAHGAVVDEGHGAGRPIVDDDDVGRLVDVVVGPRFGGADGSRDLTDGTVDVADVAGVALQEPGAAVVRVGPRALPALCLQRRDDHGPDDEREDDEHAAGDATAGVASSRGERSSSPLVDLVLPPQLRAHRRLGRRDDGATRRPRSVLSASTAPPPRGTNRP